MLPEFQALDSCAGPDLCYRLCFPGGLPSPALIARSFEYMGSSLD